MSIIDTSSWKNFVVSDLFDVQKGSRLVSVQHVPGDIPYVGATMFNNGITGYIANDEQLHAGNVLSVCYNGPVGTTFYQPVPFWGTDDVAVWYPRFEMTLEIALFLVPVIEIVGRRWAYVDKWKQVDMQKTEIPLPVDSDGKPDWAYMQSAMEARLATARRSLDVFESLAHDS